MGYIYRRKVIAGHMHFYQIIASFGKRYNWGKTDILIIKIAANIIVISLLRRFGSLLMPFSTNSKNLRELHPGID